MTFSKRRQRVLNPVLAVDGCPFFQGPEEENGEKRDIVRPRLSSRLMSIFLAVYARILQAKKTNRCSLLDSLARKFSAGQGDLDSRTDYPNGEEFCRMALRKSERSCVKEFLGWSSSDENWA
jgi:hypothetical protein